MNFFYPGVLKDTDHTDTGNAPFIFDWRRIVIYVSLIYAKFEDFTKIMIVSANLSTSQQISGVNLFRFIRNVTNVIVLSSSVAIPFNFAKFCDKSHKTVNS